MASELADERYWRSTNYDIVYDLDAWRRWLATVECGGPFNLKFRLCTMPNFEPGVRCTFYTDTCVDDATINNTLHVRVALPPLAKPGPAAAEWLRVEVVVPIVMHEVDERLRIAGVMVRDPHAKERKP